MPVEPNHDEPLFRNLDAFGRTLEVESGENLRPANSPDQPGNDRSSRGRSRSLRRWHTMTAVAAAVVLIAVTSIGVARIRAENGVVADSRPDNQNELAAFVARGPSLIVSANGDTIASIDYSEDSGEALLDMDAGELGKNKMNVAYVEQVFEELGSDDALWKGVDLNTATKEQWMGQAGLRIETNFDPEIQQSAAVASLEAEADLDSVYTQVITVDPSTGAVLAFYGVAFEETAEGNLPIKRQPGFAFLPIVVAEAFEQGYTNADQISAVAPCAFNVQGEDGPYIVNGPSFDEPITIQDLVAESPNCGAIRLGYAVGAEETAAQARNLGLTTPMEPIPSLPLGPVEVEPIELVGAYTVFANGGQYTQPWYVSKISFGEDVEVFARNTVGSQVVSTETAAMVSQALIETAENGTGRLQAKMEGRQSAGKTGATQDQLDVWYVGYTPQYVTGVWIGAQPGEFPVLPPSNFVAARQPAALWNSHMTTIHEGLDVEAFGQGAEPSGSPQRIEIPEEVPVPAGG